MYQLIMYQLYYKNAYDTMQPNVETNLNHSWLTRRDFPNQ